MLKWKQILLLLALVAGLAICVDVTTEDTNASTTESTVSPTTTEEHTKKTTTTTTSTTPIPTTTTQSTTSTTSSTTTSTTSTTTTTTTETPTTKTPVTTPAPVTTTTPVPVPSPGNWSWTDPITKETCVIVRMAIQLEFNYTTKEAKLQNYTHNVPIDTAKVVDGSCGNETQKIVVDTDFCNFTMEFAKENNAFELTQLTFMINTVSIPGSNNDTILISYMKKEFVTPIQYSYYCTKQQLLAANETIKESSTYTSAKIMLSHVQLEAFHHTKTNEFSTAKDCDSSQTPDVVPIAVGIALAGLVIVVLIAYLVARRRSSARGYTSM